MAISLELLAKKRQNTRSQRKQERGAGAKSKLRKKERLGFLKVRTWQSSLKKERQGQKPETKSRLLETLGKARFTSS
eukprot:1156469-Pelagomonas_calceolata.AAC.2